MNKNLRKAMISAICMLIVGVMSLTGVTYAWFTESNKATVSGLQFNVDAPVGGVYISTSNNTGWVYQLDLSTDENIKSTFDQFTPTSTAPSTIKGGILKFFTGKVDETVSADKMGKMITTSEAAPGTYFKQSIYMKNDNDTPITVSLAGTDITYNGAHVNPVNKRAETAMRLAVVDHGSYTNPLLDLDMTTATSEDVIIFEPNASTRLDGTTQEGKLSYRGINQAISTAFDSTADDCTYSESIDTVVDPSTIIFTIPAKSFYAVTVYIWLEGQDADCVNDIGGSTLKADLCFSKVVTTSNNDGE